MLAESIAGELISSEIEIRSRTGCRLRGRRRSAARPAPAAVRARGRARRRARRHRHPSVVGLPRAAHHRHRALPPGRGRAQVRRLAQQHVLAARARRRARRRPGGAGLRSAAAGAAVAAGDLGQLAVPRRPRLRPAQRPHADLHQELPALRRARCVRRAGRRSPTTSTSCQHPLDRRVHAGVVVDPPALLVRHGRGADLRRPDDRARSRRRWPG